MHNKRLAASILAADMAHLADDVNAVLSAGVDYIHLDVMDHHFVPNLSFGAIVCEALRKAGIKAPIDVHLMVDNPALYVEPFAKAGANLLTFHPETVDDVDAMVASIRRQKMGAGLVYNPDKAVNLSKDLACQLEMILLMSVYPGFGGQKFIPEVLPKVRETRRWLDENKVDLMLAIDGGIKVENIRQASQAGIEYFVVGSGLLSATDYADRVAQLKSNMTC